MLVAGAAQFPDGHAGGKPPEILRRNVIVAEENRRIQKYIRTVVPIPSAEHETNLSIL